MTAYRLALQKGPHELSMETPIPSLGVTPQAIQEGPRHHAVSMAVHALQLIARSPNPLLGNSTKVSQH